MSREIYFVALILKKYQSETQKKMIVSLVMMKSTNGAIEFEFL